MVHRATAKPAMAPGVQLCRGEHWVFHRLMRWMRGGVDKDGSPLALMPLWRRRFLFWGGLAVLMVASCALE